MDGVFSNSVTRFRSVAADVHGGYDVAFASFVPSNAATHSAAPHTPEGLRPVCIKSRAWTPPGATRCWPPRASCARA